MNEYNTVTRFGEREIVINKSRFIGRCWPIKDEGQAVSILEDIRKKHWDATHNCYAYSLSRGGAQRYSDDGEPGGTAGLPMMEVLKKRDIYFALVVVTRYFGGIMLGVGGLVRAYSKVAAAAIDEAGPAVMTLSHRYSLVIDYGLLSRIENLIKNAGYKLLDTVYTDKVSLDIAVKAQEGATFEKAVMEATSGELPIKTQELYIGWNIDTIQ
ncbi:MAG: YigZ family protein [Christensenellales bacterium]|jgi:uncharacterized YigZ family protein